MSRLHARRAAVAGFAAVTLLSIGMPAAAQAGTPADATNATNATVQFDGQHEHGGTVPQNFVGLSIEWSLVERYLGPTARPAFTNLLRNLGTGMLRIGGSSQDVMPFEADAPNTDQVITPADLSYVRSTLDAVNVHSGHTPNWGVVLGTAMSPPSASKPFVSPEHAHAFVTEGVLPAFAGATKDIAGIELGNEPDLSYGSNLDRYLGDLATYSAPGVTGPLPIVAPNSSEDILPWQSIDGQTVPTRYFWNWPQILDTVAPQAKARAGAFGAYASDHFYPLARTCVGKPYRCASTAALLSDEHLQSLDYQVYTHAQQAAADGLGYRLEETSTAANRGADGVSNVAASAAYALDLMFHTACPQPPQSPSANATCATGATGLNFHNAEVRAFFEPQEGNAYYNAVDYDPSDAMGAPTAAPLYYAMLLFSHFAQGTTGLHPVAVSTPDSALVKAWQLDAGRSQRRMFLINKDDHPVTVTVATPGPFALVDRMTPDDPTGAGATLTAAKVRIDGRQVAANGTWPGFRPTITPAFGHRMTITLAAGEAAVVSTHVN